MTAEPDGRPDDRRNLGVAEVRVAANSDTLSPPGVSGQRLLNLGTAAELPNCARQDGPVRSRRRAGHLEGGLPRRYVNS